MKKFLVILATILLSATLCLGALVSCSGKKGKQYTTTAYFGTQTVMVIYDGSVRKEDEKKADDTWQEVKAVFAEVEASVGRENSLLADFNALEAGETMETDVHFYNLLKLSAKIYDQTDRAFNPAVAPLVKLWGFLPSDMPFARKDGELPSQEYIDKLLLLTDFSEVKFTEAEGKYYVTKPLASVTIEGKTYTAELDFSGIGKGYAAGLAAEVMKEAGYVYGYVSAGSSSLVLLKNFSDDYGNGDNWYVDLVHPTRQDIYARIEKNSVSVSTSGDYENNFLYQGKTYSHIIDGKSGKPFDNDMRCVTVVCEDPASGDAYSTAFCVMGEEKTLEFLKNHPELEAIFVTGKDVLQVYNGVGAVITASDITEK